MSLADFWSLSVAFRGGLGPLPTALSSYGSGYYSGFGVAGDFTGDARGDILVYGSTSLIVHASTGDGAFSAQDTPLSDLWGAYAPTVFTTGDFDEDGHLDAAWLDSNSTMVRVAAGDGEGYFTPRSTFSRGGGPSQIATGDFDGDGHVDILVPRYGGELAWYRGDGAGGFVLGQSFYLPNARTGDPLHSLHVADLDGDGHDDLAVLGGYVQVTIFLNDGQGQLALAPDCTPSDGCAYGISGYGYAITSADLNGDRVTDLAVPTTTGLMLLLGAGDGRFTLMSPVGLDVVHPQIPSAPSKPLRLEQAAIAAGDFMNDGVADVLVSGWLDFDANETLSPCPGTNCRSDLLVVASFRSDGTLATPPVAIVDPVKGNANGGLFALDLDRNEVVGDRDGDGAGDACDGCPSNPDKTLAGVCGCGWPESTSDRDGDGTRDCTDECPDDNTTALAGVCGCGVASTDTDSDTVPDCTDTCDTVANPNPLPQSGIDLVSVGWGDSYAGFREDLAPLAGPFASTRRTDGSDYVYAHFAAAADLTGDGAEDLVVVSPWGELVTYRSQRDGTLTWVQRLFVDGNSASGLALGDFDEDGAVDAAMAVYSGQVYLAAGRGDGRLSPPRAIRQGANWRRFPLAAGDFDGDGHLDLVTAAEASREIELHTGDGRGGFDAVRVFARPGWSSFEIHEIRVGDLDRDGDLDLVMLEGQRWIEVLLNRLDEPDAAFVPGPGCDSGGCHLRAPSSGDLALGDMTGDGVLDLATAYAPTGRLYVGDGTGGFEARSTEELRVEHPRIDAADPCRASGTCARPLADSQRLAVGDFDGDGRADVAVTGVLHFDEDDAPSLCQYCSMDVVVVVSYDDFGAPTRPYRVLERDLNTWNEGHYVLVPLHLDGRRPVGDTDDDGAGDACETCDADAYKTSPLFCGCGLAETDDDNDTSPNCVDACDDDANKTLAGFCGCGVTERDLDGDGLPDCVDNCPNYAVSADQTDTDGDGHGNVCETCDLDPRKTAPGTCGCGTSDDDHDRDGIADCDDPDDDDDLLCDGPDPSAEPVCDAGPDVCPFEADLVSADVDFDGQGEACGDYDLDNDGTCDPECPTAVPGLDCSGHGRCVAGLGCLCAWGFGGVDCRSPVGSMQFDCPNDCSGAGVCDRFTGLCICEDFASGPDCLGPPEGQERGAQCNDLVDNDGDGRVDCVDPSCADEERCLSCPVADCHGLDVGDACLTMLPNAPLRVAGVCYAGPDKRDGDKCAGDCLCRFAIEAGQYIPGYWRPIESDDGAGCPCLDGDAAAAWGDASRECWRQELNPGAHISVSCDMPRWVPDAKREGWPIEATVCRNPTLDPVGVVTLVEDLAVCAIGAESDGQVPTTAHTLTPTQLASCRAVVRGLQDRDDDGRVDCPNDCSGHGTCDRGTGKCVCHSSPDESWSGEDCSEYVEPETGDLCFDGLDNNGNGQADCADFGCLFDCDCQWPVSEPCRGRAVGDRCRPFGVYGDLDKTGVCYGGPDRPEDSYCLGECVCVGGGTADTLVLSEPAQIVSMLEPVAPSLEPGCPCFDMHTFAATIGLDAECQGDVDTYSLSECGATLPSMFTRLFPRIDEGTLLAEEARFCMGAPGDPGRGPSPAALVVPVISMCESFTYTEAGAEDFRMHFMTPEQLQSCLDIMTYCTRDNDGNGVPDCIDGQPEPVYPDLCSQGPDNCPEHDNPGQEDRDGDGIGDACDACPDDPDNNLDGDHHPEGHPLSGLPICGDVDNCPLLANPDQTDVLPLAEGGGPPGNGIGDACEPDADFDGVCDAPNVGNAYECERDQDCASLSYLLVVESSGGALDADDTLFGCHEHRCRWSADTLAAVSSDGDRCDAPGFMTNWLLARFNGGVRQGHCEDARGLCLPGATDPVTGLCAAGVAPPPECDDADPLAEDKCRELFGAELGGDVTVACHRGMCLVGPDYAGASCTDVELTAELGGRHCQVTVPGKGKLCAPRALVGDACEAPDGVAAGCRTDADCEGISYGHAFACTPNGYCEPTIGMLHEPDLAEELGGRCDSYQFAIIYGGPRCTPVGADDNATCGFGPALPNGYCPVNTEPVDCAPGPDNCPTKPNPDQLDRDRDRVGDACDVCDPSDPRYNADGDAFCDDEDNCPYLPNDDQLAGATAGYGWACDPDRDGDDWCDANVEVQCVDDADCWGLGELRANFSGGNDGPIEERVGCHQGACRWSPLQLGGARCDDDNATVAVILGLFDGGRRRSHCLDEASGLCVPGLSDEDGHCTGGAAVPECDTQDPNADAQCTARWSAAFPQGLGDLADVVCDRGTCVIADDLFAIEGLTCTSNFLGGALGARHCTVAIGSNHYCVPLDQADGRCLSPDGRRGGCIVDEDCADQDGAGLGFTKCGPRGFCEPTAGVLAARGLECSHPQIEVFSGGPRCTPSDPDDALDDNATICGFGRARADGSCPDDPRPPSCQPGPDNCPWAANASTYNPDQADDDNDTLGDVCDVCPSTPDNNVDGDTNATTGAPLCGDTDNCPWHFNPDQADADQNGFGDACEPDPDGDGYCDHARLTSQCQDASDCRPWAEVLSDFFGVEGDAVDTLLGCHANHCRIRAEVLGGACAEKGWQVALPLAILNHGRHESHCLDGASALCVPGAADGGGDCTGDPPEPECDASDPEADAHCQAWVAELQSDIEGIACIAGACRIPAAYFESNGQGCSELETSVVFGRACTVEVERAGVPARYCVALADVGEDAGEGCLDPDGNVTGCLTDADCLESDAADVGFVSCGATGHCEPTVGSLAALGMRCADPLIELYSAGPRCQVRGADPGTVCGFGRALEDGRCPSEGEVLDDPRPWPCVPGDNCPGDTNASQADDDNDTLGDACDPCLGDPDNNPDGDGVCTKEDNCPADANPEQEDPDRDGLGIPCDPDDDNDTICDEAGGEPVPAQCITAHDCAVIFSRLNPGGSGPIPDSMFSCRQGECRVSCALAAQQGTPCGYFTGFLANVANAGVDAEFCCDATDFCVPGGSDDNATRACDGSMPEQGCGPDDNCTDELGDPAICHEGACVRTTGGPDAGADEDPCNTFEARRDLFDGRQHCRRRISSDVFVCLPDGGDVDCAPECSDARPCPESWLGCGSDGLCAARCDAGESCAYANPSGASAFGFHFGSGCCGPEGLCIDVNADAFGGCVPQYDGCQGGPDNCVDAERAGEGQGAPMWSWNPDQEDEDGDAIGDVCDPCGGDPINDPDGDGLCGGVDNCPYDFNPVDEVTGSQLDPDGDGAGIPCDADADGDGVCDRPGYGSWRCESATDCAGLFAELQGEVAYARSGALADENTTGFACIAGECRASCDLLASHGASCGDRSGPAIAFYLGVDAGEHCCDGDGFCVPGGSDDNQTRACDGSAPDAPPSCREDWECDGAFAAHDHLCDDYYGTYGCESICHQGQCRLIAGQLGANPGVDDCNTAFSRRELFAGQQHCGGFVRGGEVMVCLPEGPGHACGPECVPGQSSDEYGYGCGSDPGVVCGDDGLCTWRCDAAEQAFEALGCSAREVGLRGGWGVGVGCCGPEGLCIGGVESVGGECAPTTPADCRPGPDNCVDPLRLGAPDGPMASYNPTQSDGDGDGLSDLLLCDPCPNDRDNDGDLDGACGDVDTCPDLANDQGADADGDHIGDACDNDVDGDGLCNARCPGDCSGHGACGDAGCACEEGWGGVDCAEWEVPMVDCVGDPDCFGRGICNPIRGACYCEPRVGGLHCQGGAQYAREDVDTYASCDNGLDDDLDGTIDCMDAGCAKAEACGWCASLVECNAGKRVGDACEATIFEDDNVTVRGAGVCYGGQGRQDDLPCAGDCVCRVATELSGDENSTAPTLVDLADAFPIEYDGCPCFTEDDLRAFILPAGRPSSWGCQTSGQVTLDACEASQPRWVDPWKSPLTGSTAAYDPTRIVECVLEEEDNVTATEVQLLFNSTLNACVVRDARRDDGGWRGALRHFVLTERQEAACVALLEAWNTDVNQDGYPDAVDPAPVRCPGVPVCNGRGLCNEATGVCFCDPGVAGPACEGTLPGFPSCSQDWECWQLDGSSPGCDEQTGRCLPPPEADCFNGLDDDGDGLADCADATCRQRGECVMCGVVDCNDGNHTVGATCDFMPDLYGMFLQMADPTFDPSDANVTLSGAPIKGQCYGGAGLPEGAPCVGQCACVGGMQWSIGVAVGPQNDCPTRTAGEGQDGGYDGFSDGNSDGEDDWYAEAEGTPCGGGRIAEGQGLCMDCDSDQGCTCIGGSQEEVEADLTPTCPCFSREDLARLLGTTVALCMEVPLGFDLCPSAEQRFLPWVRDGEGGLTVGTRQGLFPPLWGAGPETSQAHDPDTVACFGINIPGLPPGVIDVNSFDMASLEGLTLDPPLDIAVDIELAAMVPDSNVCLDVNLSSDLVEVVRLDLRRITDTQELACQAILDDCLIRRGDGLAFVRDLNKDLVPDCLEEQQHPTPPECVGADNCPLVANAEQVDADADRFGDVCDLCPEDATVTDVGSIWDHIGSYCDHDEDDDQDPDQEDCAPFDADVHHGAAEVCDGVDNDCDGLVDAADPDLVLVACQPMPGVCAGADTVAALCQGGQWQPCTPEAVGPTVAGYDAIDDRCDGIDNNCDGEADEHFALIDVPCDAEYEDNATRVDADLCYNDRWDCEDGNVTCVSKVFAVEVCDGDDDDCDGVADDGFAYDHDDNATTAALALGRACDGTDVGTCHNGIVQCSGDGRGVACVETTIDPESVPCSKGFGVCLRTGHLRCDLGCDAQVVEPEDGQVERCGNGFDDDCDGATDEGFSMVIGQPCDATGEGDGEYDGDRCFNDEIVCVDEAIVCVTRKFEKESCNGWDDDCDGVADDGFGYDHDDNATTPALALGAACDGDDVGTCQNGIVQCRGDGSGGACVETTVDPESVSCSKGFGVCQRTGHLRCDLGCDAEVVEPEDGQVERCGNGVDDDCDGAIDEGFSLLIGQACDAASENGGLGADTDKCLNDEYVCDLETGSVVCAPRFFAVETCNGEDDDCDGPADEGFAFDHDANATTAALALGAACDGADAGTCARGVVVCDPGDENATTCAESGEDPTSLPCSAGLGECRVLGHLRCDSTCDAVALQPSPLEQCGNAKDDDCDGATDEDFTYLGTACNAPLEGDVEGEDADLCLNDLWVCQGGVAVCESRKVATETCDGEDDDCDGEADEGFVFDHDGEVATPGLALGSACDGDDNGTCANGIVGCNGPGDGTICVETTPDPESVVCSVGQGVCKSWGTLGCDLKCRATPISPTGDEQCGNGVDDDCDGAIDEGFSLLIGQACDAASENGGLGADTDKCLNDEYVCDLETGSVVCAPRFFAVETCNGEDDDCDGRADEGFAFEGRALGSACDGPDAGTCDNGWVVCNADKSGAECREVGVDPSTLECTVGVGACAKTGRLGCDGACGVTAGQPAPGEICGNHVDDDCNGVVDEGFPEVGKACDSTAGDPDECKNDVIVCDGAGTRCAEVVPYQLPHRLTPTRVA